ncbi:MAG: polyhydroxyalkanoic acid system family protein [Pirellulaceae bacterium]|jgi:hypothetical protein|nr:polyhydroxyalkanoic acid system family protein [Pirellulaceae bacterium]
MPQFKTQVSHGLGQSEALTRLKGFVDKMLEEHRAQISHAGGQWTDNVLDFTLTSLGVTVKGQLLVEDDAARVEGHLPLMAMPFRGTIEKSIADALRTQLV